MYECEASSPSIRVSGVSDSSGAKRDAIAPVREAGSPLSAN